MIPDILEFLAQLDPTNDDHWTANGSPKLQVVREMASYDFSRADILNAAPHFSRENPVLPNTEAENTEPEAEEAPDAEEEGLRQEEGQVIDQEAIANALYGDLESMRQLVSGLGTKDLEVVIEMAQDQYNQMQDQLAEMENLRRNLKINMAVTKSILQKKSPDIDNMTAIQEYIASQQGNRIQRHQKAQEIRRLVGNDLGSIDPRSMLDRAMARKRARGAARPAR